MNSRGVGGASGGLDARNLLRQKKQRIAVADRVGIFRVGIFRVRIFWAAIFGIEVGRITSSKFTPTASAWMICVMDVSRAVTSGGEARLNIGSDGHFDGATDASDSIEHLRPGNELSVGDVEGVGHGGAAGGDGLAAAMFNHGGAAASHALMRTSGCEA